VANVSLLAFIVLLAVFWVFMWLRFRGQSGRVRVYPLLLIARAGIRGDPFRGPLATTLSRLGWLSILVLVVAAAGFYYIAIDMFVRRYITRPEGPSAGEGFVPLLPGVTIPIDENLVLILVAVGLAVLVHELAHALMARAVGVRVKDAGFILLAFIPGAFVEPEESDLKRAPLTSRLKVYSAGVSANVALGLLALAALLLASPTLHNGVLVVGVDEGSPAELGGLREGMVVVEVNGIPVRSVEDFTETLKSLGVGDRGKSVELELKIVYGDSQEIIRVSKPEGLERIGVRVVQSYRWEPLAALIEALLVVNMALALVNAAPILIPTPAGAIASDGAHFVGDIVARTLGEKARLVVTPAVGVITLLLIVSLITLTPVRFTP